MASSDPAEWPTESGHGADAGEPVATPAADTGDDAQLHAAAEGSRAEPLVPLRAMPSVNEVANQPAVRQLIDDWGREMVLRWIRSEADAVRHWLRQLGRSLRSAWSRQGQSSGETRAGRDSPRRVGGHDRLWSALQAAVQGPLSLERTRAVLLQHLLDRVRQRAEQAETEQLGRVINATGVVLHTGLGRAPLSPAAMAAVQAVAGAANVELDLQTGNRRTRGFQLLGPLKTLTGAEDALVVNNNAAATLLTLQALCAGREVLISRGQLIEIGGSFRLPEIFTLSGAVLREVGTTNRTRLSDYERAITPQTAAILHVHTSNYRVVGFADAPGIEDLVPLARRHNLLAIDDIGSGCLIDVSQHGLDAEPTFGASVAAGADLVLGSGDKLLGGPQAGIIVGRSQFLQALRQHPLARCVRVDKLTLAALSATLESYLRGSYAEDLPLFRLLLAPVDELRKRARAIAEQIAGLPGLSVAVREEVTPVGGGSLPGCMLPTAVLAVRHARWTAAEFARRLRTGRVRIVPRVTEGAVVLDLRSVLPEQDETLALGLRLLAASAQQNVPEAARPPERGSAR